MLHKGKSEEKILIFELMFVGLFFFLLYQEIQKAPTDSPKRSNKLNSAVQIKYFLIFFAVQNGNTRNVDKLKSFSAFLFFCESLT